MKISPITFGGGYAMISLIENEVVEKNKWIKREDIVDVLTIAQTAPGAIAINSAIFIGYRVLGLAGAVFALAGIVLPTLIIVIIVSMAYNFFHENPIVEAAFKGIGAAVIALITYAGIIVGRAALIDKTTWLIAIISILVMLLFNINPVFTIIAGFFSGIIIINGKELWKRKGSQGKEST